MKKDFSFKVDRKAKTVPTDYSWQFGIGNDHAFQLLRTDVCEHLKLAHDELGIKYVRFHGIFDDDMLAIQTLTDVEAFNVLPDAEKIQEVSFHRISVVLDNVLKCGLKPFLEISFMPKALASSDKIGLRYKNNITMPADIIKWCVFVESFIKFLVNRYGNEEIESWYFEIWNEPDLELFFDGEKSDYLTLYAATARTIKGVNENFRVGGPSTSACEWIEDFIKFCNKNTVPCDFISTHHYPGDAFGNVVADQDAKTMFEIAERCAKDGVDMGDMLSELFFKPQAYKEWKKGAFINMDKAVRELAQDKPFFISEWNSMAVYAAPVHDEKYSSAFVVKSVMDARGVADGYMFWCCSDIFEETFDLGKPFHGSFGIVNNCGIPKPNFWAFKILSRLYGQKVDEPITNDDVECNVFVDGKRAQILLYSQDFDYYRDDEYTVEIIVDGRISKAEKFVIDSDNCNPKAEWKKIGSPDLLTPKQAEEIKQKAALKPVLQDFESSNGKTVINLKMRTNDVVLIEIE